MKYLILCLLLTGCVSLLIPDEPGGQFAVHLTEPGTVRKPTDFQVTCKRIIWKECGPVLMECSDNRNYGCDGYIDANWTRVKEQ